MFLNSDQNLKSAAKANAQEAQAGTANKKLKLLMKKLILKKKE